MIKSIFTTLIAILVLIGASIWESKQINNTFDTFYDFLEQSEQKLKSESASPLDLKVLEDFWLDKKRSLHVWIPHNDIKEIDLWVSECVAYTEAKKYDEAICKIEVLKVLAKQVPNTFILKLENIF